VFLLGHVDRPYMDEVVAFGYCYGRKCLDSRIKLVVSAILLLS
jgi:hypothetical protein